VRVLLLDDDPATTDLLKLILEPLQIRVITANSTLEGLELVEKAHPDLIILDLMMPDLDSWQMCAMIRQISHLPILILSAVDRPRQVAEALDAGADDYLIKPVPNNVLIAHINKLLRRAKLAAVPILV
jgi:DNA-binding response OmpR family regulator